MSATRLPDEYESKPCAWCGGAGKVNASTFCGVCQGSGTVAVPRPAQTCPVCGGTGKGELGHACLRCDGGGWADAQKDL